MTAKYYALLTTQGAGRLANAAALGTKLNITQMAVGDGGGTLPSPNATQTALKNEVRRAALNALSIDAANSSQIIAEQVIPESEGGFWIREIGLFDDEGTLIAVANCPETYKPQLQEGSGRTQTVRMILIVSGAEAVTLKVDPAVVLATRKYVDEGVIIAGNHTDTVMATHLKDADPHTQYALKASPTFTGKPAAPTPAVGDSSTRLATTHFVQAALETLSGTPPGALNTLEKLAAALGNDAQFATTLIQELSLCAPLNSPGLTGTPTAPTAPATTDSTQLATTAFVQALTRTLADSVSQALQPLATTAFVQEALAGMRGQMCTAWVNFSVNGGVVTINGSFNVSSVTRTEAGVFRVAFASPMANANYAAVVSGKTFSTNPAMAANLGRSTDEYSPEGIVVITIGTTSGSKSDAGLVTLSIFGGV